MISSIALRHSPDLCALPPSIRFTEGERRAFQSRERDSRTGKPLTVSQYTERYRVLTDSKLNGRWQNINAPYAVLPMDLWTHPTVREIYLCAAPQIVKTQIAFNCIHYAVPNAPGPIMYVMPTENKATNLMKKRLRPMLLASPKTAELLSSRDSDTTQRSIKFLNGASITMAWATSVSELSSDPICYYIGDEVSKWPGYAAGQNNKEASPIDLLRVRANSYADISKGLFISSPSEDPCAISDLMHIDADTVMQFEVSCPICGHAQFLDDEHIIILHNITDFRRVARDNLARYICDKCGMYWDDYMRVTAVRRGVWVPGQYNEDGEWVRAEQAIINPIAVGLYLPSWYNVNMSLSNLKGAAVAKMRQNESPEKKQVFVTQHKAIKYKDAVESKKESEVLRHRTKLPSGIAPKDTIALTAGIDSHKWGYRFSVYAWTEDTIGFSCHKIHHGTLGTLEDVRKLIFEAQYQIEESSQTMPIWRAGIDTGGNKTHDIETTMTEEIYQWLGSVPPGVVYGIKGASHNQPINVKTTVIEKYPHSNTPIQRGLVLYIINTDALKTIIYWKLSKEDGEPQRFFLDADTKDTDDEYVRELLAEEAQRKKNRKIEWVKIRSANHYLDTAVIAHACADWTWQPSLKILNAYIKKMKAEEEAEINRENLSGSGGTQQGQSGSRW
jgi:phage terminase large subunit GpA-like protein